MEEDIYNPLEELKAVAFQTLLLNPGTLECQDWIDILLEECGTEVVDAYGPDPVDALVSLTSLWEDCYYDPATGLEKDFHEWASAFATDESVDLYYALVEECKKNVC